MEKTLDIRAYRKYRREPGAITDVKEIKVLKLIAVASADKEVCSFITPLFDIKFTLCSIGQCLEVWQESKDTYDRVPNSWSAFPGLFKHVSGNGHMWF